MKDFQSLLLDGKAAAARVRLCTIARSQPDQMAAIAAEAAEMISAVYDRFRVEPVHEFCTDMELDLPEAIANAIDRKMKQPIERTKFWLGELPGITQERLARECRRCIVTREYKEAARLGAAMLELAKSQEELVAQARYLALALATLYHDRDRVPQVIGQIAKCGGRATAGARFISEHFALISRQTGQDSYETGEREWRQRLTQAIVHFQSWLPGPMEAGEPAPGQVERFVGECMAILRAGLAHGRIELFIDALTVIYDYCPGDPSRIANAAGVEDRIFTKLGPRAKLCAVRSMFALGQNAVLRKGVLELARAPEGGKNRLQLLTGIIGGLRHEDFFDQLRAWYEKTDVEREEELIVDALGRIANPDAGEILLKRLRNCIRHIADPANERRAYVLLTALGRLARGRGLDSKTRNQIVRRVMELVEHEARDLSFTAASEMFSMKLDDLDPDLRALAARKVVAAMWAAAPGGAVADNSWRAPMVNALKKFGSENLNDILDEAEKHATRYCGAMGSFADALAEIGDERAVPLLESMARIALTHVDDPKQSQIFREKVRDVATDELVDLNRDELVYGMLYTLMKIGGNAGRMVVLDFADQVQAGRIASPGANTTKILLDTKLKAGNLRTLSTQAKKVEVDERELRQAISRARGGLLTSQKNQIAAIAALGRMRHADAVPVLAGLLAHKNALIAGAAYSALAAFLHPLPTEVEFDEFMLRLLEDPDQFEGALLAKVLDFIRRELPKRAPYDKLYDRQIAACVEDEELAHRLRGAFLNEPEPAAGPKLEDMIIKAEAAPVDSSQPARQDAPPAQGSAWTNELERRRAAFRERKQKRG